MAIKEAILTPFRDANGLLKFRPETWPGGKESIFTPFRTSDGTIKVRGLSAEPGKETVGTLFRNVQGELKARVIVGEELTVKACSTCTEASTLTFAITNLDLGGVGCSDVTETIDFINCLNPNCALDLTGAPSQAACNVHHKGPLRTWQEDTNVFGCDTCTPKPFGVRIHIEASYSDVGCSTWTGYLLYFSVMILAPNPMKWNCHQLGKGIDPCNPPDVSGSYSTTTAPLSCGAGNILSFDYTIGV